MSVDPVAWHCQQCAYESNRLELHPCPTSGAHVLLSGPRPAVASLRIMPIEQCGAVGKCMSSPSSYREHAKSRYSYTEPTIARIAAVAVQALEAARALDLAAHEKNVPAIENNKAVAASIIALNEAVGMPKRWSERDRNSRSRYPKTIGHDAGYLTDIAREVKTDDGFASATATYERLKKEYEAYAERGKEETEQLQRKRELEQQALVDKRRADMELATILLRYALPIESTWSDVLEHLRGKDQRVDLAVAMQQTRGDWSDGPYRVSDALQRFTIRDDEDKAIAACVVGCLAEFEDGRVFRDTSWSYDTLFASTADRQLVADVQKAMQQVSDQ